MLHVALGGSMEIAMTDRDDFLAWVETALYEAEVALHNGDAGPRRAIWSRLHVLPFRIAGV